MRRVSKLNFTYHGKRQRRGRSSWPRGRQGVGVDPGAGVQEGARVGVERRNYSPFILSREYQPWTVSKFEKLN